MIDYMSWKKKSERGFSALGIVLTIGVVAIALGIAILVSTDSQIRNAFTGQVRQDTDWAVRAAIKMTEDAWLNFIGVRLDASTTPPSLKGTIYNAIEKYSREEAILWTFDPTKHALSNEYALLPLFYERYKKYFETDAANPEYQNDIKRLLCQSPYPLYRYQVDLTSDGWDTDGDGIIPYDPNSTDSELKTLVYNNIDNSGLRRFNAIITVTGNDVPHYSSDNVFYVFPVRYTIILTVIDDVGKRTGGSTTTTSRRIINGTGSCAFFLYRRSFSEYVMFTNDFANANNAWTSYPIMRGFTYDGPVHTNTSFTFMNSPLDKPRAHFTDIVTQVGATASGEQYPIFDKGFFKNSKPIAPPPGLGDVKGGVLAGRIESELDQQGEGVYLPVNSTGDGLNRGGVYVFGNVESFALSQGEREQTYVITQNLSTEIPDPTTTIITTTYYANTNYTNPINPPPNPPPGSAKSYIVEEKTNVIVGYIYTITCNYQNGRTYWIKDAIQKRKTTIKKYYKSGSQFRLDSSPSPSYESLPNMNVETDDYTGIITINDDSSIAQTAFYIKGHLGTVGAHSGSGDTTTQTVAPKGLSGTVDKETQLTICAYGRVVITGDTIYECRPVTIKTDGMAETKTAPIDEKNILGILSETENVIVDYDNPRDKHVNIDASIMAIAQGKGFTAQDYPIDLKTGSGNPYFNIAGGIIQDGYGPIYNNTTTGYMRNFIYDPRLKTQAPPLFPKQSACRMQTENQSNESTLQLVWLY